MNANSVAVDIFSEAKVEYDCFVMRAGCRQALKESQSFPCFDQTEET